jgi:transcriptional regulator with XRE-family HTH domain
MGRRFESAGLQSLYEEFVGDDPELVNHFERTLATMEVGVAIRRLRTEAGLTMKELAERVGTQPSAIARLEHAGYEGHSLSMLRKIAAALGRRVEVRFPRVEVKTPAAAKAKGRVTKRSAAKSTKTRGETPRARTVTIKAISKGKKAPSS